MLEVSQSYRNIVYSPIRQFNSRMRFTLNGVTKEYDDNVIISTNILEEMNTLSTTIPSNEIKVTLDNTSGEFNMLNLSNMHEIIASRPKIEIDLGLTLFEAEKQSLTSDFTGKITGSIVENGNKFTYGNADVNSLKAPSASGWEAQANISQVTTDRLKVLDGNVTLKPVSTTGGMAQHLFSFNIIRLLEDKYGIAIWKGKTSLTDKIMIAKELITATTINWHGYGSSVEGNNATIKLYKEGGSWEGNISHVNSAITKLSYSAMDNSLLDYYINSDGFIHLLAHANASNGVISSELRTDFVNLTLEVSPIEIIEWIPMGVFYLYEWKNEQAAMSVTLFARDNFDMLGEISYENLAENTLYNLAVDILTEAGITNYIIDDSLKTISANFKERLDSRSALQHIGIASQSAVFQDRFGVIRIRPFAVLDKSNNYLTYTRTQNSLFGYSGATTYALVSTGGGMRYIDFEQMYDVPDISLDKSIYEVIINIYDSAEPREKVYINTVINGKNGASFKIDNPLIKTEALATKVAEWFIHESNFSAIYKANWRQNPILECADVILMEDSFDAKKQTRIYRQEFEYEGYLAGKTESKGGL